MKCWPMSALGYKWTFPGFNAKSALVPRPDIAIYEQTPYAAWPCASAAALTSGSTVKRRVCAMFQACA